MTPVELLRQCQGDMTQSEFAEALGIGQSYLSMLLNGQRTPTAGLMLKLARLYPAVREQVLGLYLDDAGNGNGQPATCTATAQE